MPAPIRQTMHQGLRVSGKHRSLLFMTPDREVDQIKRAAAGDPAAIRAIVVRHTARLHALAFRMLQSKEEAEDVVQETFLRAWKALPGWEPKAKLSTWLYRVALNLCYDRVRKSKEVLHAEPPDMIDPGLSPHARLAEHQQSIQVRTAISNLPDRQRTALTLCALENHSNRDAADILEISVEALESLLARGRRQLRSMLSDLKEANR